MRILYAAGNRYGSFFQLRRLLHSLKNKKHSFCIAAYSKSLGNIDIDYNLDSLLNFTNPDGNISFNQNYSHYYNEVKKFDPDLVISDLEIYSSLIGFELNKQVWQVSPILLYPSLPYDVKYKLEANKDSEYIFKQFFNNKSYTSFIIRNSSKRLVYSHICDIQDAPVLDQRYEWCRPEFVLFDEMPKTSSFSGAMQKSTTTNNVFEGILDESEYKKRAGKGIVFISDGTPAFLHDAFYNQMFCYTSHRIDDLDTIIASQINKYYGIGDNIQDDTQFLSRDVNIALNNSAMFLKEML